MRKIPQPTHTLTLTATFSRRQNKTKSNEQKLEIQHTTYFATPQNARSNAAHTFATPYFSIAPFPPKRLPSPISPPFSQSTLSLFSFSTFSCAI